ncbi:MAG: hypothetical protein WBX03_10545, partial [Terriglobales bacterium]
MDMTADNSNQFKFGRYALGLRFFCSSQTPSPKRAVVKAMEPLDHRRREEPVVTDGEEILG